MIYITVVDIYQEWSGPCRGLVANLRRLKNELGDEMLHFAVVSSHEYQSCDLYTEVM